MHISAVGRTSKRCKPISIPQASQKKQTIYIDSLSAYKTSEYLFEYYSDYIFIDTDTGIWVEDFSTDDDLVNLTDYEVDIFIYEACRILVMQSTKLKARAREDFVSLLGEKYEQYNLDTPSEEVPLTY